MQTLAFSPLAIALGCVTAAANVFGGLVITAGNWERGYVRYFVALGAGFMLATALLEMLPASIGINARAASVFILSGFLLVHLVEHSFIPHFHFGEETHAGEFTRRHVPYSVISGLAIHTLFDGIAIGSSFLVSTWLGWIVFAAVFVHKVPEGFTAASVMIAAGEGKRAALVSAAAVGLASIVGVLAIEAVPFGLPVALPLAAGVTLYVAATDLLPEVNREPGIRMAAFVFLGSAVVFILQALFRNALP